MRERLVLFSCIASCVVVAACASPSGQDVETVGLGTETPLPPRRGTIVVDGCQLDAWQRSTLASASARRVLSEVVMLCLVPRLDGTVGPRDPSAKKQLADLAGELTAIGYRFHLAVSFTDESGTRYDGGQTQAWIADPAWRATFRQTLVEAIGPAAGVELDMQQLPNGARDSVTSLVRDVSGAVRPTKKLGVFVPPSVTAPSDLPGGEAFSRADLAPLVDRLRISTLDYAEGAPGPTIDPGWAVDAGRLALLDSKQVDIAYPLYGTDFGPRGRRTVTYLEAKGLASSARASFARGPTGAPFVTWTSEEGEAHQTWFDDAESTARALGGWSYEVLAPEVGVVFYGLGAEDPTLWDRLAARLP